MNKTILFAAIIIIALTGGLISIQILHNKDYAPVKSLETNFIKKNLTGRKITVLTNHPHIKAAEAIGEWFQERTGAVVQNIAVGYGEMLSYTLSDFFSHTPGIDVIMLWYIDLGTLVEQGVLMDITDFIDENKNIIKPEDFIQSIYDPYTLYNGRRWCIPYDGDTHVLFYRKSLLKKYGMSPPETWDEYLNIAKIITENEKHKGIYGTAIMAPPTSMAIIPSFMNRLGGYGGRLLDENGRPLINSEEAVSALSAMLEHAEYALPTPMETDWEVSRDAFLYGRAAMVEQWTDIGIMAEDPEQSLIQGDWGVVQMPRGSGKKAEHSPALNAGFSIGISTKTSDSEAALEYLLFAASPEISLRINLINGGIDPTRISILNSHEYKEFAPELSEAARAALKKATSWPRIPQIHKLNDILMKNIIMTLEGHKTPRQALDETQEKWLEILGFPGNEN